jgi:hypothetical protein
MLASVQPGEGIKMSPEYVAIVDLLKKEKLFLNGKPRNKSAFLRLLRERYKLNIQFVLFPGKNKGRPLAAITKKEADEVIKKLTTTHVVTTDEIEEKKEEQAQ